MAVTRYRHLAIRHSVGPTTAAERTEIEARLGTPLPGSFRAFLDAANGGSLEFVLTVETVDGPDDVSFSGVLSSRLDAPHESLIRELRDLPDGVLLFARDGGGGEVYLDLRPPRPGRVVAYLHHADPHPALAVTAEGWVELAPSFDAFVEALRPDRSAIDDHLRHDVFGPQDLAELEAWLDAAVPDWHADPALVAAHTAAREGLSRPG